MSFGGSAFGASNAFGASTPFGSSTPAFGAPSSSAFGATATPFGSFGTSSSAFAAPSTPFGASSAPFASTTTPFGANPTATPFGSTAAAPAFGSSAPFGTASTPFGASSTPAFQSSTPYGTSAPASTPFGGAAPTTTTLPPFGATAAVPNGEPPSSRNPRWSISSLPDNSNNSGPGKFIALTAMQTFNPFSIEELRVADYARNDRGGAEPPPGAASISQPTNSNPFAPSTAQPTSTLFPNTPASNSGFTSTAFPSTPSLFSQSAAQPTIAPAFPSVPTNQPASVPSLFQSTSSPLGFTGASIFSSSQPAATPSTTGSLFPVTPAPSLFQPTNNSAFPSTANGPASTGSSLFTSATGSSLFPASTSFPSSSIFNNQQTQAAAPPQQSAPATAPLQASLTANPFGSSALFSQSGGVAVPSIAAPSTNNAANASTTQSRPVSVIVTATRRARGVETSSRPFSVGNRRPDVGGGLFSAAPMRPWGREGSLFDVANVLRPTTGGQNGGYVAPWRTPAQAERAANIKKLVIEPVEDDPIFSAAAAFAANPVIGAASSRADGATPESNPRPRGDDLDAGEPGMDDSRRGADSDEEQQMLETEQVRRNGELFQRDRQNAASAQSPQSEFTNTRSSAFQTTTALPSALTQNDSIRNQPMRDGADVLDLTGDANQLDPKDPRFDPNQESLETSLPENGADRHTKDPPRRRPPFSENPDLFTQPDLEELAQMSDEKLSRVPNFTVGIGDIGEVMWEGETDVRDLNLDEVIRMAPREVCVYPDNTSMPPVGQGLNKPARVQLHGIWKVDKQTRRAIKDTRATMAIVKRLKDHCESEGLTFLGYELRTGTWSFHAKHF